MFRSHVDVSVNASPVPHPSSADDEPVNSVTLFVDIAAVVELLVVVIVQSQREKPTWSEVVSESS